MNEHELKKLELAIEFLDGFLPQYTSRRQSGDYQDMGDLDVDDLPPVLKSHFLKALTSAASYVNAAFSE